MDERELIAERDTIHAAQNRIAYDGSRHILSRRRGIRILSRALLHLRGVRMCGTSIPESGVCRFLRLNERGAQ